MEVSHKPPCPSTLLHSSVFLTKKVCLIVFRCDTSNRVNEKGPTHMKGTVSLTLELLPTIFVGNLETKNFYSFKNSAADDHQDPVRSEWDSGKGKRSPL